MDDRSIPAADLPETFAVVDLAFLLLVQEEEAFAEYSDCHPQGRQGKQDSYEELVDTAYILDLSLYSDSLV